MAFPAWIPNKIRENSLLSSMIRDHTLGSGNRDGVSGKQFLGLRLVLLMRIGDTFCPRFSQCQP